MTHRFAVRRSLRPLAALLAFSCAPKSPLPAYDNALLELAAGFSAKEVCSCVFVAEQPAEVCREWTRVSPAVAKFRVDEAAREVHATALLSKHTVARWVDDELGCVFIEP